MGTRLGAVSKFGNRTHTRVTRFGNTAGKPVPMAIPSCPDDNKQVAFPVGNGLPVSHRDGDRRCPDR